MDQHGEGVTFKISKPLTHSEKSSHPPPPGGRVGQKPSHFFRTKIFPKTKINHFFGLCCESRAFKVYSKCSNFGCTSIKSRFESYFSNFISKSRPKKIPGAFGARTVATRRHFGANFYWCKKKNIYESSAAALNKMLINWKQIVVTPPLVGNRAIFPNFCISRIFHNFLKHLR